MKTILSIGCMALAALTATAQQADAPPEQGANAKSLIKLGSDDASNTFTIDANLMTRGEIRRGGLVNDDAADRPDADKANFIQARTRLGFGYQKDDWLMLRVTAQHSGIWGQENKGVFNLYEAWATLKARCGVFATVGRQSLSYDDERIIGSNDWSMAAYSHDCLKVGYEGHGHKVHAIAAFNQNAANIFGGTNYVNGSQPYKSWLSLWYHYDLPKIPLGFSLIAMDTGLQSIVTTETGPDNSTKHQQLVGAYVNFNSSHVDIEGSYYRQMGTSDCGLKIKAWMASAKAQYAPNPRLDFTLGYDYLSGDKKFAVPPIGDIGLIRHDVIRGFNPIYGSHHQFYGMMDFFYVSSYIGGFTPGLQNLYFSTGGEPIKNLRLDLAYHYLATATKLDGKGMTLGHEFELNVNYNIIPEVKVAAGYSFMSGSKTMELLKRSNTDRRMHWAWLSLTISPRIFTAKW